MLSYEDARQTVIDRVSASPSPRSATATVSVWDGLGYVLAQDVLSDRDYPPFDRSTRDGYAVRAAEISPGGQLPCTGEIKAGDVVTDALGSGTCVRIMTGAALPSGADAVVMLEHVQLFAETVKFERGARAGQNVIPRGSEASSGSKVLSAGTRLGYAELALAAQVGAAEFRCAAKPRVAILSTGDEIVAVDAQPGPFQIRNTNSVSLSAQVRLAGGEPVLLGNAPDHPQELRAKIERGLTEDLLLLSGGVSMGKYDLVESVLKDLGTEFYFDAVAIRPGKPAVFGHCRDTFVFGLPGNPVSTMVTFELFVTPALDLLSGTAARPLAFLQARLAVSVNERPGLTHFLPARIEWPKDSPQVTALRWQGSGDIGALAHANCFLVVPADHTSMEANSLVCVLMRKDVI